MADSKFASFLKDKKIDTRRLLAVSKKLEALTPEDRAIKHAQKHKKEGKKDASEKKKPHTGRPVTPRAIEAVLSGEAVSGPTKTRILRAVNAILETKKASAVDLKTLF